MPSITGKYELYKSEDMEPHLVALGFSYLIRKLISAASPSMEITVEGNKVTVKMVTPIKSKETVIVLGEEYEETMPDDSKLTSVTKIINDHEMVTESVVHKTGVKAIRHHLFTDTECVVTTTTDGVEKPGFRHYKRK